MENIMNFRKAIVSLLLVLSSFSVMATTYVAPSNRVRIWEGSAVSFSDTQYTIGSTTALGTVRTLKSNTTVTNLLTTLNIASNAGGLDMSGKYLSAVSLGKSGSHQRITENGGALGQCVAFAKSMTGAPGSNRWYRGISLASYVSWNGAGYYLTNNPTLPVIRPGTMIAHFGSTAITSPYSANSINPHVAIFLSWSYNSQGYIDGINVIDENLVHLVAIPGQGNVSSPGLIQKHKLPWACTAGSSCGTPTYHVTFFSSNYHIVDVR